MNAIRNRIAHKLDYVVAAADETKLRSAFPSGLARDEDGNPSLSRASLAGAVVIVPRSTSRKMNVRFARSDVLDAYEKPPHDWGRGDSLASVQRRDVHLSGRVCEKRQLDLFD